MSTADYVPEKYITVDDALQHFGWTNQQINDIDEVTKERYLRWVREANNNVEGFLFQFSDVIPLADGSKELTYVKSAALNWVVYKKRDKDGSKNATSAKNDYLADLKMVANLISKEPSKRYDPIETITTDVTADIIVPYSQTQGYPPDLLY